MRVAICGQFFLDPELWDVVREHLPTTRRPLRIWSVGCHVGKEPYSVAILLAEKSPDIDHEIVASDVDAAALEAARRGGPFTARDVAHVSPERRARFFEPGGPPYFVLPELQRAVRFEEHDVRGGPFARELDLVLYRNVEPFFSEGENAAIHGTLRDALRRGGLLFVGAVERVRAPAALGLEPLGDAVYRRTA